MLNLNMQCIETAFAYPRQAASPLLNLNMQCIETVSRVRSTHLTQWLNLNMQCIETYMYLYRWGDALAEP